jgi:type III restriction enzyme
MANPFFEHPILNSPYEYPKRHWELDSSGQPTQRIIERRRRAEFITPITKPRKRKGKAEQRKLVFDEGKGLSTEKQRIETVVDDADLEEVYNTERHLLYVACTRARDYLLVTSVDPASEFLDDLKM